MPAFFSGPATNVAALMGAGGGGGTIVPSDIAGLVGWWKADTGVTTSSGNVTAVTDQSTSGATLNNYTTSGIGGAVPYSATGFNSRPAFVFSAANDVGLATGAHTVNLNSTTASFYIVGQMLTSSMNAARAVGYIGFDGGLDYTETFSSPAITRAGTANGVRAERAAASYSTFAISLATNYRIGTIFSGSTVTMYVNNVAGTGDANSMAFTGPGQIEVGNSWNGSGGFGGSGFGAWGGAIAEIVVYNVALNSTQRTNLDDYFKNKWGL